MARPAEKARAMLNKWVSMRDGKNQGPRRNRRPHLASDCDHLADAQRFRGHIVKEISSKISAIQNPGLGEHAIRELNDEINHLMREKYHWNRRIYELGGEDYNKIERERQIEEGDTHGGGYRYFGAAKELPGVAELLAQRKEEANRTKHKKARHVSPDYYGWRDEEDGVLLQVEAIATKQNDQVFQLRGNTVEADTARIYEESFPSETEIQAILLEHQKKALLAKYQL